MEQQEIRILKKTKKNEKEVDIKPYIYEMEIGERVSPETGGRKCKEH